MGIRDWIQAFLVGHNLGRHSPVAWHVSFLEDHVIRGLLIRGQD